MAEPVAIKPPGRAILDKCGACRGTGREGTYDCPDCEGTGIELWHACPQCGDISFDYINGRTPEDGMVCRVGCGARWTVDHPGWRAQVRPAKK